MTTYGRILQAKELFEYIYKLYSIGSIIGWRPALEVFGEYRDIFRTLSKEIEIGDVI